MVRSTVLITFGSGTTGWQKAGMRVYRSAKKTGLFDEVVLLDAGFLKAHEPKSWDLISSYLEAGNKRGFGYWIWKPAILKWARVNFPNHQILYVDAGCEILVTKTLIDKFQKFLEASWDSGGVAFSQNGLSELSWTKSEVLQYHQITDEIAKSDQLYAGCILTIPSLAENQFIERYYQASIHDSGFLFNDDIRETQNQSFVEHRHDQSNYSLIWKKMDLHTIDDLCHKANKGNFLIYAARNRTSLPANSPELILKTSRVLNKIVDKLKQEIE